VPTPADYEWHSLDTEEARGELTAEMVLSDYHFARGRDLLEAGQEEAGIGQFDLALDIGGENKESLNNVGSAAAEGGAFLYSIFYGRAELLMLRCFEIAKPCERPGSCVPPARHPSQGNRT
jgi:hypothetical protein